MKVKPSELVDILSLVKPGLSAKGLVEGMDCFHFTGARVLAYNDHICVSCPYETDFRGSIPSEEVYKIISGITEDEVELTIKGGKARISADRTIAELSLPIREVDEHDFDLTSWEALPTDFVDGVQACLFSVARGAVQDVYTAICVRGDRVFSTDNYRVSMYQLDDTIGDGGNILIPIVAAGALVQFPVVEFSVNSWAHFRTADGVIFSCRTMMGDYVDPEPLFQVEGVKLRLPTTLKDIIPSVLPMAAGDLDESKMIKITIDNGWLVCRGEGPVGWVEKKVEVKYTRGPVAFQTNPIFLAQVLGRVTPTVIIGDSVIFFSIGKFKHIVALEVQ